MRIITETELRDVWKQAPFVTYTLPENTRLTPAARQFLTDWRIELVEQQAVLKPIGMKHQAEAGMKPEHCTHLNGRSLVSKHHPRIRFRGLVDSFYGAIVEAEVLVKEQGTPILQAELRTLRKYAGQLMASEVSGKELPFIDFYSWTSDEIRDRSHHTQKYYGMGHFRAHPDYGAVMARLNSLRTRVRELEVAASELFGPNGTEEERPDILLALNRFSSLFYILMCRLKSGGYDHGDKNSG